MTLRGHDLSCVRGGRRVFSDLNFELTGGQALVLVGPNGSGKSTLLRVIAGLLSQERGNVSLDGQMPETALKDHILYEGHLDGVKPALSVAENLAFWAQVWGLSLDRITPALKVFALETLADLPAGLLSAGQTRRLGLARLGLFEPGAAGRPIWLLDEPTVSLDAANVALFAGLVRSHLQAGGMALAATHIDLGLGDQASILSLDAFAPHLSPSSVAASSVEEEMWL
ncbi:MAG: heme ABC exporter ATP-binding protein CcmA [Parvibaculaceae bacterium]|nr:heme ABC exporter ATP-binding protein CcmA [Parvibaculaceae bacterium]